MQQTQNKAILEHLQSNKTITPLEALEKFGCFRLSSRIRELRDMGHNIVTTMISNNDKHFAQYNLVQG